MIFVEKFKVIFASLQESFLGSSLEGEIVTFSARGFLGDMAAGADEHICGHVDLSNTTLDCGEKLLLRQTCTPMQAKPLGSLFGLCEVRRELNPGS
jgi:hypothetical protein